MLLPIHIAAGGLAMVLGAVALSVKKGSTVHRRAGAVFVGAMLVMGVTAGLLGIVRDKNPVGNALGGLMTIYFVVTALMTVRAPSRWTRGITAAGAVVAFGLALTDTEAGIEAFRSPGGVLNGVPFAMLFFIASIMILAGAGDARVLWSGVPRGGARLARHLWRMCFGLFIAAGSFFSVPERVAKILPAPLTSLPLRMLPILLVFVAMFYWLWRVRRARGALGWR